MTDENKYIMSWSLTIEDENSELIELFSDELFIDYNLFTKHKIKLKVLKYLDPYGDLILNQLQLDDLIHDIKILFSKESEQKNIINFINSTKDESHTYIRFIGD
jgi:hypothetical protein